MEFYFLIKKDIYGNLRYLIAASCGLFKLLAPLSTRRINVLMDFLAFCYVSAQKIEFAISDLNSPPVFGYCTYTQLLAVVRPRCLKNTNQRNLQLSAPSLLSSLLGCLFLPSVTLTYPMTKLLQSKMYGSTLNPYHFWSLAIGLAVIGKSSANKASQRTQKSFAFSVRCFWR
jgi:hypothetical protein